MYFVLGAICGLAFVGLVYICIFMLKMNKKSKGTDAEFNGMNSRIDYLDTFINKTIDEIRNEIRQTYQTFDDFIEKDYIRGKDQLHNEIASSIKYTDSRFDKTISKFDERMDHLNNQLEVTHKEVYKELNAIREKIDEITIKK